VLLQKVLPLPVVRLKVNGAAAQAVADVPYIVVV
jgi:hypothetical protein